MNNKDQELQELGAAVQQLLGRDFILDPFHAFFRDNDELAAYDIRHTTDVMTFQHQLFDQPNLSSALDSSYPPADTAEQAIRDTLWGIVNSHSGEKKRLINVALWHDIGKGILRARHAMEGADYILELDEKWRLYLQNEVHIDPLHFDLFADLIRFHDYYGVLATGEASPLIFLDALYPVSNRSIDSCDSFLDLLLLVNIADTRAAIQGQKVPYEKMEVFLKDLKALKRIHGGLGGHGRQFDTILQTLKSESVSHTQERLRRLLREGILKFMAGESCEKNPDIKDLVKSWFTKGDHAEINWALSLSDTPVNFCQQFALTCRLDYALGFVTALVDSILDMCLQEKRLDPTKHSSVHVEVKKECAVLLLTILRNLVGRYGELTSSDRRIGLELQFLGKQRQQVADRTQAGTQSLIQKVLHDSPAKRADALAKIVNETLAWIM